MYMPRRMFRKMSTVGLINNSYNSISHRSNFGNDDMNDESAGDGSSRPNHSQARNV
jgi:hypothetical protein